MARRRQHGSDVLKRERAHLTLAVAFLSSAAGATSCTFVDNTNIIADVPEQPTTCAAADVESGACDPYDQINFIGTQSTALCSFLFDCCSGVERVDVVPLLLTNGNADVDGDAALTQLLVVEPDMLADELACVRGFALAISSSTLDDAVALLDEAGARRTFDRDAAEVCIGQIEEAAELCAPPLLLLAEAQPEECGRIFAPAVAEGGVCTSDADCVDIDDTPAFCFANTSPDGEGGFDVSLSGECASPAAVGEPCPFQTLGDVDVCDAGLFCASTLVCTPVALEGEACGERPCDAGLRCVGTCAPLSVENEPCAADADCAAGLICATVPVPDVGLLDLCVAAPVIDPEQIRFDFCLDQQGNASLADVIPDEEDDGQ